MSTPTLTAAEIRTLHEKCAGDMHAMEQAVMFIAACHMQGAYWQNLAGNPDLVRALDGCTADVFLGWR
jgi:hypothetical protein